MRAFGFWLLDYSLEHDTYHDQTIYEEPQIEGCVLLKSNAYIAEKLLEWCINLCSVVNNTTTQNG